LSLTLGRVDEDEDEYRSSARTRNSHRRVSRVFTLRARSGCASNLLTLFERVDKAAVELFIVHGTNGDGVLTANSRAASRDYRVRAFFTPPADTFPVAGSPFPRFSLLPFRHFPTFFSARALLVCSRERARTRADSGARLAYLRMTVVRLFENRKTRPRKIERVGFYELRNPPQ